MIPLDLKPRQDTYRIDLPALKFKTGKETVIPHIVIARPTTATEKAAFAAARRAVPSRNEGEDDEAFLERARADLDALGVLRAVQRLGMEAGIDGAIRTLALIYHAVVLVESWEGFGDRVSGELVEPGFEAVAAAMRNSYIASQVEARINAIVGEVAAEGNA